MKKYYFILSISFILFACTVKDSPIGAISPYIQKYHYNVGFADVFNINRNNRINFTKYSVTRITDSKEYKNFQKPLLLELKRGQSFSILATTGLYEDHSYYLIKKSTDRKAWSGYIPANSLIIPSVDDSDIIRIEPLSISPSNKYLFFYDNENTRISVINNSRTVVKTAKYQTILTTDDIKYLEYLLLSPLAWNEEENIIWLATYYGDIIVSIITLNLSDMTMHETKVPHIFNFDDYIVDRKTGDCLFIYDKLYGNATEYKLHNVIRINLSTGITAIAASSNIKIYKLSTANNVIHFFESEDPE